MTHRQLAQLGAAILVGGLFLPIVSLPIVGSVNLFNGGTNLVATLVVALAAIAAFLAARDRAGDAIWPGASAAVLLAILFANLQWRISSMKRELETDLADNPFAGIARAASGAVQVEWGWLVLAAGAGLICYAAVLARREVGAGLFAIGDRTDRIVASLSALILVAALLLQFAGPQPTGGQASEAGDAAAAAPAAETGAQDPTGPDRAEVSYIRDNLDLYGLNARYFDSLLDGRVPGVEFKIRNKGNKTLSRVEVRVVFEDADGRPIAEETYMPVLVGGMMNNDPPLRPGYIWQQEQGSFFTAKKVPSEWAAGKAKATIVDIEFEGQ